MQTSMLLDAFFLSNALATHESVELECVNLWACLLIKISLCSSAVLHVLFRSRDSLDFSLYKLPGYLLQDLDPKI